MSKKVCKFIKSNCGICKSAVLKDSDYCFFHSPVEEEKRKKAQSKGGKQGKRKTLKKADADIRDISSIVLLLNQTINQILEGQLDVKIGNAVGYLSNILLKAIGDIQLEEKINEIEDTLNKFNKKAPVDSRRKE